MMLPIHSSMQYTFFTWWYYKDTASHWGGW